MTVCTVAKEHVLRIIILFHANSEADCDIKNADQVKYLDKSACNPERSNITTYNTYINFLTLREDASSHDSMPGRARSCDWRPIGLRVFGLRAGAGAAPRRPASPA